ncbi:MAG: hypothetical protein ACKN92_08980, partial [Candidatus Nanopelagicaceae bacterium]
ANAATKKPTPTPTKKVTATPTVKTSVKASVKATSKATATSKTTVKPTAKATASATATKKKIVYKPKPRKKVKLSPSPKPVWPPKGYIKSDDIYAKIPTSKELIGLTSANKKLASDLKNKNCENLTCGAILATSIAGCNYWEFNADVVGPTSETDKTIIKYGSLISYFGSSKPKEITTYILNSEEPVKDGFIVSNIKIACHRDIVPTDIKIPSNIYMKVTTD